jgi:hypothetical protein
VLGAGLLFEEGEAVKRLHVEAKAWIHRARSAMQNRTGATLNTFKWVHARVGVATAVALFHKLVVVFLNWPVGGASEEGCSGRGVQGCGACDSHLLTFYSKHCVTLRDTV